MYYYERCADVIATEYERLSLNTEYEGVAHPDTRCTPPPIPSALRQAETVQLLAEAAREAEVARTEVCHPPHAAHCFLKTCCIPNVCVYTHKHAATPCTHTNMLHPGPCCTCTPM